MAGLVTWSGPAAVPPAGEWRDAQDREAAANDVYDHLFDTVGVVEPADEVFAFVRIKIEELAADDGCFPCAAGGEVGVRGVGDEAEGFGAGGRVDGADERGEGADE